jgi:transposase
VRFVLLPGHRFDTVGVAALIKDIEFGSLIADKAFDSNWIIEDLNERKAKIVISQHQRRAQPLDIDKDIYKWRHLIENFFGKLKERAGPGCLDSAPRDLSGFLPGYAERGALRFCRCAGRA